MGTQSTKTTLGKRYRLLRQLGDSMADVYEATDLILKRRVIVKRMKEVDRYNAEMRERFVREARLGSLLSHRYIMQVYELCGEGNELPYIVAEYIPGETLDRVLASRRLTTLSQKLVVARCIAEALGHAHSHGVMHRDLKPSNCMVTKGGVAKLIDMGVARKSGFTVTSVGGVVGTPAYMAPEQVRGEEPTPKVDIYAFGVTLFEILTGKRLVESADPFAAMHQILNGEPDLRPLRAAGVPPELAQLVEKCLKKSPAERPVDFQEVLAVLRGTTRAPRPQAKGINLAPVIKGAAIGGLLALAVAGVYLAASGLEWLRPVAPPAAPAQVFVRIVTTPVIPAVVPEAARPALSRRSRTAPAVEPAKEFVAPPAAAPEPGSALVMPEPIAMGVPAMPAGGQPAFAPPPPESGKAVWRRALRPAGRPGTLRVFQNQLVFERNGETFTMQVVLLRCGPRRCVAEGVSERSLTLTVDRKTGGLLQEGRVNGTGRSPLTQKLQRWEFDWK